ncbi:hypothetical protein [Sphingomonas sp. 37zxx]|uniref:hypothetical protein n=1 Tax=Sphingomonas sp. 37zxx TaxID=1550073 RepID=UPI0018CD8CA1|nr:hypothetical protein [Sphingomonas sp. 37zxx]
MSDSLSTKDRVGIRTLGRTALDKERQQREIEINFDRFERMLGQYLLTQRDRFALMRDGEVIGFFDTASAAGLAGAARFEDRIYSIQKVTDEPVEFGIYAHAIH